MPPRSTLAHASKQDLEPILLMKNGSQKNPSPFSRRRLPATKIGPFQKEMNHLTQPINFQRIFVEFSRGVMIITVWFEKSLFECHKGLITAPLGLGEIVLSKTYAPWNHFWGSVRVTTRRNVLRKWLSDRNQGNCFCDRKILLLAEILHQLRLVVYPTIFRFLTSQVVQDFSHQQYHKKNIPFGRVIRVVQNHRKLIHFPKTNSKFTPENGWLGDDPFILGQKAYFQGLWLLVSGRLYHYHLGVSKNRGGPPKSSICS